MYSFKNNLVNLSNSILKVYGIKTFHDDIPEITSCLLNNGVPKRKLAIFLFDGYGKVIQEENLDAGSFIYNNRRFDIDSVFPPTTVACTTSFLNGKYPIETGFLAWEELLPDDNIPTYTFSGIRVDMTKSVDLPSKIFKLKDFIELVNEKGEYKAGSLLSFTLENNNVQSFFEAAQSAIDKNDLSYCYFTEPDASLHDYGNCSKEVKEVIKNINLYFQRLVENNPDTLFLTLADHGHIDCEKHIELEDYSDVMDLLAIPYNCMEARVAMLFAKPKKKKKLLELVKNYFSEDFYIYTKQEYINKKLFGDVSSVSPLIDKMLGDVLLVSKGGSLLMDRTMHRFVSAHAGATSREIKLSVSLFNADK